MPVRSLHSQYQAIDLTVGSQKQHHQPFFLVQETQGGLEMSAYKPSPLSFNSPRTSPFRRPSAPSSPSSPSTVVGRPSTPPHSSPGKNGPSPMTSPSKLKQSFTATDQEEAMTVQSTRSQTEPLPSTTLRGLPNTPSTDNVFSVSTATAWNARPFNSPTVASDNLTKLPPQLLHSMREAFSVLDHNNTGSISQSDVNETLASLGISDSSQFFSPGSPQQLSLPQFLNQIANIFVELSPQQELLNAFSAFDDDDSGQVDVAELKDALLHTTPTSGERLLTERDVEAVIGANSVFTGRRVFARNAVGIAGVKYLSGSTSGNMTGDVFRYQEFVGSLTGGGSGQTTDAGEGVKV